MSEDLTKDEQAIAFAMELRHDIVSDLITNEGGKRQLPRDLETIYALRALLKDNDVSVISRARLTSDSADADNNKRAAAILEKVLEHMVVPRRDPIDQVTTTSSRTNSAMFDSKHLPTFELSEGATSAVGDAVNLDEINARGRALKKDLE